MTSPLILPDPGCSFGYPLGQVAEILNGRLGELWVWMVGRKLGVCDMQSTRDEAAAASGYASLDWYRLVTSHGPVVYPVDLARFLQEVAA